MKANSVPLKFSKLNNAYWLQFAEYVFHLYDTDRSGYLNFKEFIAGVSMTSWKNPKTRIEWIFKLYDLDSDGSISAVEMRSVLKVNESNLKAM